MSLLALEPGMQLWTEMPSRDAGGGVAARDANAGVAVSMVDGRMGFTGQTAAALDGASLEDILNATVGVAPPAAGGRAAGPGRLSLRRAGGLARLEWTLPGAGAERAVIRILDLSGRTAAVLVAPRTATGYAAEWRGPARSGAFIVRAEAGGRSASGKIAW
jgi:hypothetical protein